MRTNGGPKRGRGLGSSYSFVFSSMLFSSWKYILNFYPWSTNPNTAIKLDLLVFYDNRLGTINLDFLFHIYCCYTLSTVIYAFLRSIFITREHLQQYLSYPQHRLPPQIFLSLGPDLTPGAGMTGENPLQELGTKYLDKTMKCLKTWFFRKILKLCFVQKV